MSNPITGGSESTRPAATAKLALTLVLVAALCLPAAMLACPQRAYAAKSVTGTAIHDSSKDVTRYFGSSRGTHGVHEVKLEDGSVEIAYCIQDGSHEWPEGEKLTFKDSEKLSIVSSKAATAMALAWRYIWVEDLFRTPAGKKLANDAQRYGAMQGACWYYMHKYDGRAYNDTHFESGGVDITGSNKVEVGSDTPYGQLYQWVKDNWKKYDGGCLAAAVSGYQDVATMFWCDPVTTKVPFRKVSSNKGATDGNDQYSLRGARYAIYDTKAKADAANKDIKKLEADGGLELSEALDAAEDTAVGGRVYATDAAGEFETKSVFEPGQDYYVVEIYPSPGYERSQGVVKFTAKADYDGDDAIQLSEAPELGRIDVAKRSSKPDATDGNDRYSLAGAVYGVWETAAKAAARNAGNAVATGKTDAKGTVVLSDGLAAGTYYVAEISPSAGYKTDQKVHEVKVKPGDAATATSDEEPVLGKVKLAKSSNNGKISDGNACYSLSGAVYGVFRSKADAETHDASKAVRTHATTEMPGGSFGFETEAVYPLGTYYMAETSASEGFMADPEVHEVAVTEAVATTPVAVPSGEEPRSCPIGILLQKLDRELGAQAQGAATLEGAEFTVRYYDGYYAGEGDLPAEALRTWVLATAADGTIDLQSPRMVSGDDLYKDSEGRNAIPLGTVSVVETKAPQGYNLETPSGDPKTFVMQVVEDASSPTGAAAVPMNFEGAAVGESNTAIAEADTVVRGDYRLVKECNVEVNADAPQEQKRVLVPDIQFQLINDNDQPVVSPEDGETAVPKGGVVCTITTDEDGLASTRNAAANGWGIPDGWTAALAYGTYVVHEVIPDDVQEAFTAEYGTGLLALEDWKATVSDEGQYAPPELKADKISQTPLKIVKVDAESGRQVPLQVSYQLYDANGELVTWISRYPEEQVIDTWTSNAKGEVTLPMLLPGGTYTIREVAAPDGYALNLEGAEFTVEGYRTWDDPITVEFSDVPIKGIVEIEKAEDRTGEAIAGAVYVVEAAEDIVTPDGTVHAEAGEIVATLRTDEDGRARTGELYLGAYTVYEAKSPEGWALDTAEHAVCLASEGQDVPVVEARAGMSDKPTTVKVAKADGETGEPLAHAKFRIWRDGAQGNADDGEAAQAPGSGEGGGEDGADPESAAGIDMVIETGDDGTVSVGHLPHGGGYHIVEVEAPEGYHLPDDLAATDFEVDDQGFVGTVGGQFSDTLVIELSNHRNEIGTVLTGEEGEKSVGPDGQVTLVDTVRYAGAVPGREYTVTGTLHLAEEDAEGNRSDAGEVTDADGNPVTASATFTAEEAEGYAEVEFTFDASGLAGRHVVAFEEMRDERGLFAVHADISDADQTVEVEPSIGTTLSDGEGGKEFAPGGATLFDTVRYEGLVPGLAYTMTGTIHVAAADGAGNREDAGVAHAPDGSELRAEVPFVPEEPSGEVQVAFDADLSELAGRTLVAFEELRLDGETVATHEDISDEGQSIKVKPSIGTELAAADGKKAVAGGPATELVDTVAYTGLIPGTEYILKGTLHVADVSKGGYEDAGPAEDASGKEAAAEATFTPESPDGKVEVTFKFDASELAGKRLVAFEELLIDGEIVATHEDISDEAQSVDVTPSIATTLAVGGGGKQAPAEGKVKLVDTVRYRGLVPGTEYTVAGNIRKAASEGGKTVDAGWVANADGTALTAETTFSPEEPEGEVEVVFEFDAAQLAGADQAVAFERLFLDGELVALHEDIEDADQTVDVAKPGTPGTPSSPEEGAKASTSPASSTTVKAGVPAGRYGKTGEQVIPLAIAAGILAAVGAAAIAVGARRKGKGK